MRHGAGPVMGHGAGPVMGHGAGKLQEGLPGAGHPGPVAGTVGQAVRKAVGLGAGPVGPPAWPGALGTQVVHSGIGAHPAAKHNKDELSSTFCKQMLWFSNIQTLVMPEPSPR